MLRKEDPREDFSKLVDPRLGDNYPLDSVHKVYDFFTKKTLEVHVVVGVC